MENTGNNTIINIFKDKRSDFYDGYHTEHSLEDLIGGRIKNNVVQIRQALGSIFYGDDNLELISKLSPVIKKMNVNTWFEYRYVLIEDLFVFNVKNKEEHEKYWSVFSKKYNVEKSKDKDFEFPSIYIGLGRTYDNLSFAMTVESDLGFTQKDFKHFEIEDGFTPLDTITIEGTKSFFRLYAIFDTKDEKAKKEMEKYYNLDYGLDKFEKKVF